MFKKQSYRFRLTLGSGTRQRGVINRTVEVRYFHAFIDQLTNHPNVSCVCRCKKGAFFSPDIQIKIQNFVPEEFLSLAVLCIYSVSKYEENPGFDIALTF